MSISSAAYELAAERAPLDLAGLELENARVLIVGAGKMTRLLLTHMASHGAVGRKCTILNRSYQRAKDMADEYKEGYDVDIDVVASDGDEQVAYDLAKRRGHHLHGVVGYRLHLRCGEHWQIRQAGGSREAHVGRYRRAAQRRSGL